MTSTPKRKYDVRPDGRLTWDQYFMRIAQVVAERSTCLRAKVGAVVVKDKRIVATGYNGAPSGMPHCSEVGCLIYTTYDPEGIKEENCYRTIHAEINAIAQAAKNGVDISDADFYITHSPCIHCLKVLINTGVKNIYFLKPYKLEKARYFLKHSKVRLIPV